MKPKVIKAISHFFFPNFCAFCGKLLEYDKDICDDCRAEVSRTDLTKCLICGMEECCCYEYSFDMLIAPFYYDEKLKFANAGLKFHDYRDIAGKLAEFMYAAIYEKGINADIVLPVPFFEKDSYEDGIRHSQLIAKSIAKLMNAEFSEKALTKTRRTEKQHRLSREQRSKNLKNAFSVTQPACIKGKTVLLVDDIFTTGSTMNECAAVLKKAGAASVYAVVDAKVKKHPQ